MGKRFIHFFPYTFRSRKKFGYSELKTVLISNSAIEWIRAGIYMTRKNGFFNLLHLEQRIRWKNGCHA